jgi:hypothetical protein
MPADAGTIRVHLNDLSQMFNAMDPSPFSERDLRDEAERFIVSWARDLPATARLALEVEVDSAVPPDARAAVGEAVRTFFRRRAEVAQRELRTLLRRGRRSLVIGLVFLAACVTAADMAGRVVGEGRLAEIMRQSFTVAGWVAMWRPMEIFLYAWWPLVEDRRLYERLSEMTVVVREGAART